MMYVCMHACMYVCIIELKSFNNHLKQFSVVHSDRPKHVYLNPLSNSWVRT